MDDTSKIIITPKGVGVEGPPLNIFDAIQLIFSAMLGIMKQTVEMAPAKAKEFVKGDIYEFVNAAASNILEMFAPEYDLHPDLTDEAIMLAEEQLLEQKLSLMTPEQRQNAQKRIESIRAFFAERSQAAPAKRAEQEERLKSIFDYGSIDEEEKEDGEVS